MESSSAVDSIYDKVKAILISFTVRPGERINEVELSKKLKVSRTPLREALNRLTTEGFLRFEAGRGFYCRELNVQDTCDLYELRLFLEKAAGSLALARGTEAELDELEKMLDDESVTHDSLAIRVAWEERFHEKIAEMSHNRELHRLLTNVNQRIRFVRGIDLNRIDPQDSNEDEHRLIIKALRAKDAEGLDNVLTKHITRGVDQVTEIIRDGFLQIYLKGQGEQALALFRTSNAPIKSGKRAAR